MTCREFWECMPELYTDGKQHEHLIECSSCSKLLERQLAVKAGLRRMAQQTRSVEAPGHLEEALLAAFRQQANIPVVPARHPSRKQMLTWVFAAAAMVTLAIASFDLRHGARSRTATPAVAPSANVRSVEDFDTSDSGFMSLPYSVEAAVEDGDVVDVEVPRSALVALGVPAGEEGGDLVTAEVALGPDGMPEAVRLLP
jgi:hypothetical protein